MSTLMKVFVFLVQFSQLVSAKDCTRNPRECLNNEDETSLMQVRQTVERRQDPAADATVTVTSSSDSDRPNYDAALVNQSADLEAAQNLYKATVSNTSIARYAVARASANKAQAIYDSLKAQYKKEGRDFANTKAGRVATNALMAALDEKEMWKRAIMAESAAKNGSDLAEDDWEGKHEALLNITKAAINTTNVKAEAAQNLSIAKIKAQHFVDRVTAEVRAKQAIDARLQASNTNYLNKLAAEADKKAAAKNKAAKKAKWKAWKSATNQEWRAHYNAVGAQRKQMEAHQAEIDQEVADKVAQAVSSGLQPEISVLQAEDMPKSPLEEAEDIVKGAEFNVSVTKAAASQAKEIASSAFADAQDKSREASEHRQRMVNAARAATRALAAANDTAYQLDQLTQASVAATSAIDVAQADLDSKVQAARSAKANLANASASAQDTKMFAARISDGATGMVDDKLAEMKSKVALQKKAYAAEAYANYTKARAVAKAKWRDSKLAENKAHRSTNIAMNKEFVAHEKANEAQAMEEVKAGADAKAKIEGVDTTAGKDETI